MVDGIAIVFNINLKYIVRKLLQFVLLILCFHFYTIFKKKKIESNTFTVLPIKLKCKIKYIHFEL